MVMAEIVTLQLNEPHNSALSNLCRVCGNRLVTRKVKDRKGRVAFVCKDYAYKLLLHLHIDISQDEISIHPTQFCLSCYYVMYDIDKSKGQSIVICHTSEKYIQINSFQNTISSKIMY